MSTNFKKPKAQGKKKKSTLGDGPEEIQTPVIQNLHKKASTGKDRIHFLISPERKKELKMWAVMHDKDVTTILLEGLELWKQAHAL